MNWDIFFNSGIGYLLGSVPTGLVVGYIWLREDIRNRGSGKTGATNVLRTAGKLPAAIVVVADISKGAVPAVIGRFVFDDDGAAAAGASAAIVGHIWPVFAGFRGGRGVAAACGGILGLTPFVGLIALVIAASVVASTRIVSLMSIVTVPAVAAIVVALVIADKQPVSIAVFTIIATVLIELLHIPNIRRLLAGTEPKMGRGGESKASE